MTNQTDSRGEAPGLVGFTKQSDPSTVYCAHSDGQARRIRRMRLVVKGAVIQMQEHLQKNGVRYRAGFGTVTYGPGVPWEPNHIRDLMRHYRRWHKRRKIPFRCIWVAELQKRGAVHYHFVFFLPRGFTPPMPDKQGWWPHGSSNVKWARKPVGYLIKYTSKGETRGGFPKNCRLFGVSGSPGPLGWFRAPYWARKRWNPTDKIVKRGGFWCNLTVGIGLRSPWVLSSSDANGITLKYVGFTTWDVIFCNWHDWERW